MYLGWILIIFNILMTSLTEGDETEREDEDVVTAPPPQPQRPRTSDISSMGKMIVTIGGNSENKEASVSSGKLLIEVRDERSREQVRPFDNRIK